MFRTDSLLCVAFAWPSPPVTGDGVLCPSPQGTEHWRARAAFNHCLNSWWAKRVKPPDLGPLGLMALETENNRYLCSLGSYRASVNLTAGKRSAHAKRRKKETKKGKEENLSHTYSTNIPNAFNVHAMTPYSNKPLDGHRECRRPAVTPEGGFFSPHPHTYSPVNHPARPCHPYSTLSSHFGSCGLGLEEEFGSRGAVSGATGLSTRP